MRFVSAFAYTVIAVLVATPVSAQSIVGTWQGGPNESTVMVFTFTDEGTGSWSVDVAGDQPFSDRYVFDIVVNYDAEPFEIDLVGIDHGFLADKTMFGIFRLEGDSALYLDFENGAPDADPATVRPVDFTSQTVRLERVDPAEGEGG